MLKYELQLSLKSWAKALSLLQNRSVGDTPEPLLAEIPALFDQARILLQEKLQQSGGSAGGSGGGAGTAPSSPPSAKQYYAVLVPLRKQFARQLILARKVLVLRLLAVATSCMVNEQDPGFDDISVCSVVGQPGSSGSRKKTPDNETFALEALALAAELDLQHDLLYVVMVFFRVFGSLYRVVWLCLDEDQQSHRVIVIVIIMITHNITPDHGLRTLSSDIIMCRTVRPVLQLQTTPFCKCRCPPSPPV